MSVRTALPRSAVAALFIERQHLDRPRTRRLTAASLVRFAEDAGGIQLDSINVVERAHHLTEDRRIWAERYSNGRIEQYFFERIAKALK